MRFYVDRIVHCGISCQDVTELDWQPRTCQLPQSVTNLNATAVCLLTAMVTRHQGVSTTLLACIPSWCILLDPYGIRKAGKFARMQRSSCGCELHVHACQSGSTEDRRSAASCGSWRPCHTLNSLVCTQQSARPGTGSGVDHISLQQWLPQGLKQASTIKTE